jgi:GNAT superfamily N-acetyltransferase
MLTKARPGDETRLLELVTREPYLNLFLIANLEQGLGTDCEVWVQDDVGIIQRYGRGWIVDAGLQPDLFDYDAAASVIDTFAPADVRWLLGRPEAVDPLATRLIRHRGRASEDRFAVLTAFPVPVPRVGTPRPARSDDLERLVAVYADAGDISRSREAVEAQLPRIWLSEDRETITSVAVVTAESRHAAMIGGVFTPPVYRRQGYASALIHALAAWIVARGRAACLFYDNPVAGRIYLRLGFREIGRWRVVRFDSN